MRLELFLVLVFVSCIAVASPRHPAGVYSVYPFQYNPSYELSAEAAHARQLIWSLSDIITVAFPRPTIRATYTMTYTMTCTQSVARNCRFNQNPFKQRSNPSVNTPSQKIEAVEYEEEQFPISPSVVQSVAATQVPSRGAGAAEPQFLVYPHSYEIYPQNIESAFNSGTYNPVAMPFYGSHYPLAATAQRQLFSDILTVTTTVSTVLEMTTITQVPRCSKAGPILQCPINI